MSWFKRDKATDDKLPKLEDGERRVRTEGLWQKCEGCRQIIWKKDLEANFNVCPKCGSHGRIDAVSRLRLLFDGAEYDTFDTALTSSDPLGFVDNKPYHERLQDHAAGHRTFRCADCSLGETGRPACADLRHGYSLHRRQHGFGGRREDRPRHRPRHPAFARR